MKFIEQRKQNIRVEGLTLVCLVKDDLGPTRNVARLYSTYIDSDKEDRAKFFRKELVCIECPSKGSKVVRVVMGVNNALQSLKKSQVAIEYDAILGLGLKAKSDEKVLVRRATQLEKVAYYVRLNTLDDPFQFVTASVGIALAIAGLIVTS